MAKFNEVMHFLFGRSSQEAKDQITMALCMKEIVNKVTMYRSYKI